MLPGSSRYIQNCVNHRSNQYVRSPRNRNLKPYGRLWRILLSLLVFLIFPNIRMNKPNIPRGYVLQISLVWWLHNQLCYKIMKLSPVLYLLTKYLLTEEFKTNVQFELGEYIFRYFKNNLWLSWLNCYIHWHWTKSLLQLVQGVHFRLSFIFSCEASFISCNLTDWRVDS